MKAMKKLTALALALVMAIGMSATALAATGGPNFTKADSCAWSTPVTAGESVTLKVGPADASYRYTGFADLNEAAENVTDDDVTVNYGAGEFTYTTGAVSDTNYYGDACAAATITITPDADYYGPISVRVTPKNAASAWTYVDMTVYSEAPETAAVADAEGISLIVADVRATGNTGFVSYAVNATVEPASETASSVFCGAAACAQTYPTAMGALQSLISNGTFTVTLENGYINAITPAGEEPLVAYSDENWNYYGWNYCVIRNGVIVDASSMISASVLPIQNSDVVCWAFGTSAEAAAYFANLV